jgi:ribosomal protein S18 acetylase RimI-like enzyme
LTQIRPSWGKLEQGRNLTLTEIQFHISPAVSNDRLNSLFAAAWANHRPMDFQRVLSRSLLYVCAFEAEQLIGFVNVAWDGGIHGFLLDPTVHPDCQRRCIGIRLVRIAVDAARERGVEWLHVDYEPHLRKFYRRCGFRQTEAGLIHLNNR